MPKPSCHLTRECSKNEQAAQVMGYRRTDSMGMIIDFPCELDYHCPVCQYEQIMDGEFDLRLEWSEYNGFLWCSVCNRDYPTCLCCGNDIDKAIRVYLKTVEKAKVSKNE